MLALITFDAGHVTFLKCSKSSNNAEQVTAFSLISDLRDYISMATHVSFVAN